MNAFNEYLRRKYEKHIVDLIDPSERLLALLNQMSEEEHDTFVILGEEQLERDEESAAEFEEFCKYMGKE